MTRRWIGTWLALGALLIAGVVSAPEAHADTLTFRYVSSSGPYVGTQRISDQHTPAGSVAPTGSFWFTSAGSSFTLQVDDVAVLDGATIPVLVVQEFTDGTFSWILRCVRIRETAHRTSAAGAKVHVVVYNKLAWLLMPSYDPNCTGQARAGTAYVGL